MACCGGDDDDHKSTPSNPINENRKCRDILFLILFIIFWGGMFVIGGIAINEGIPERLRFGIDKNGMLCGYEATGNTSVYRSSAAFKDKGNATGFIPAFNLKSRKKLYYLNQFELLNPVTLLTGDSVCVEECPGVENWCNPLNTAGFPCRGDGGATEGPYMVCPYAYQAEDGIKLTDLNAVAPTRNYNRFSTNYIDDLYNDDFTIKCITGGTGSADADNFANQLPKVLKDLYYELKAELGDVPVCHLKSLLLKGPCYATFFPTTDIYNRCLPDVRGNTTEKVLSRIADEAASSGSTMYNSTIGKYLSQDRFNRYMSDVAKGILLICMAGLLGGIVLSMVWLILLRFFAGIVAWLIIIFINLLAAGCTILASAKAGLSFKGTAGAIQGAIIASSPIDPTKGDRKVWTIITWVMVGVTCFLFLFTLLMIRRIKIAVACIKVASQAMGSVPTMIFWPFIPFILYVAFAIWWIFVTSMLYTAGDIVEKKVELPSTGGNNTLQLLQTQVYGALGFTPPAASSFTPQAPAYNTTLPCNEDPYCYYKVEWNKRLFYAMIYHLFGFFWTSQFIIGIGYVVLAGAVASFYWARGKSDLMPTLPLLSSIKRTFRYHLGSVALGSFIIAVVQFIRAVLEYIDRQTKKQQGKLQVLKWAMCCVKYCMWYVEKVIKFINKTAYIIIAIKGTGFCQSAVRGVYLLVSNSLRVIAVNIIGDFLIFLGKISVVIGAGFIAFLISTTEYYNDSAKYPDTALSSPLLPIIVSGVIAFFVATFFFQVYEMCIDTVLLCFCEDCEQHNGKPAYAPPLLMEAIGTSEKAMAKKRGEDPDAEAKAAKKAAKKKGKKKGKKDDDEDDE